MIERSRVRVPAEAAGKFSSPKSTFCADSYFGIRSAGAQEVCESRGGRPGLPVPSSPYGLCGRKATWKAKKMLGLQGKV